MRFFDKFTLLNKSEQELFNLLKAAMPRLQVFPQVSLSQVFNKLGEMEIRKIGRMSVDFLICRENFSIVAAVELQGPHHQFNTRQKGRDALKRAALEDAGIPLVEFWIKDGLPDLKGIRDAMAHSIVRRRKNETRRDEIIGKRYPARTKDAKDNGLPASSKTEHRSLDTVQN
jgi:very-short-patch-repair endonuclease